jgi:prophage DNA circulation protein
MCSKAEVQAIVSEAETRLERKMESLETRQIKRLEDSHMAIAKSVSGFGNDLKQLTAQLDGVLSLYNGASTLKSFIVGLASTILAITAIGASVIWIIKQAMK